MTDLTATIANLSTRWMQGWMDQDRAVLEEFLAPDYALIISAAPTHLFDRANWLDTAVGPFVCTRFAYSGVHVRSIDENYAIMSAIADFDATMAGIDRSGLFFVTDIWRRAPGSRHGWQVCARYSSKPGGGDASIRAMTDR